MLDIGSQPPYKSKSLQLEKHVFNLVVSFFPSFSLNLNFLPCPPTLAHRYLWPEMGTVCSFGPFGVDLNSKDRVMGGERNEYPHTLLEWRWHKSGEN